MKMSVTKFYWASACQAMMAFLPVTAMAGEPASANSEASSSDTVVYWSVDFNYARSNQYGAGAGAGFATAINGDIGKSGWLVTGNIGYSRSVAALSNSNAFYGSLMLGYQWQQPGYYFSLGSGINIVDNNETPPGGVTDGTEAGAIFVFGVETKNVDALYAQSYGAYSTANDQVYFHAKGGYKTAKLRFGPEFTVSDQKGGNATLRYGAFVGDIPVGEKLNMVVSAGYQQELDIGAADGFYGTIGFTIPLSHR